MLAPLRHVFTPALALLAASCNERPAVDPQPGAAPKVGRAPVLAPVMSAAAPIPLPDPDATRASEIDEPGFPGKCAFAEDVANDMGPAQADAGAWAAHVRQRLLPRDRVAAIIERWAWKTVDELAERRFDQLASLLGPEGLCLRATKGVPCVRLTVDQVRRCGRSGERWDFDVDWGDDGPHRFTCAEVTERVFFRRDLRRPTTVTYNCFPRRGRGNNPSPVIFRPAAAFIEFYAEQTQNESWLSLWLVFDTASDLGDSEQCRGDVPCNDRQQRLYLVELMAEYWGI